MRWTAWVAGTSTVAGLAMMASCRAPTQMTLVITTDAPCPGDASVTRTVNGTNITIGNGNDFETKAPTASTLACAGGDIGTLVVTPGDSNDEVEIKVVTGYGRRADDCKYTAGGSYGEGCIVARRALRFVPHSDLRILIPMRMSCSGVTCDVAETCRNGACVSATISNPEVCATAAGCGEELLPQSSVVHDAGAGEGGGDAGVEGGGDAGPLGPAIAIAAGSTHTCALLEGGTVRCWGGNGDGQLGTGAKSLASELRPVSVDKLGITPTALTAGDGVTCVLGNGRAQCWGKNSAGQLGDGSQTDHRLVPTDVLLGDAGAITQLSQSLAGHACGVIGGVGYCWGANGGGQLGDGDTNDSARPVIVWDNNRITKQIATSHGSEKRTNSGRVRAHSCARRDDGSVVCWGADGSGQCTGNVYLDESTPQPAPDVVGEALDVTAGALHSCAILGNGTVTCWGSNEGGQLGGATGTAVATIEVPFPDLRPGINATALSAGANHTCALMNDQSVYCWGDNSQRQMGGSGSAGADADAAVSTPVKVPIPAAQAISAGQDHTCALTQDRDVYCWGANDFGQLGDGTKNTPNAPVKVLHLTD